MVTIDGAPIDYLNPTLIDLVEALSPTGRESSAQFLINSKGGVLQYLGQNGVHLNYNCMANIVGPLSTGTEERRRMKYSARAIVDVVFKMGRNYFRNTETLQLTVVAIQNTSPNRRDNGAIA